MAANRLYRMISVLLCLIILFGSLYVFSSSYDKNDICRVSFINRDGTLLSEINVHKGTSAFYNGEEPTQPSTTEYNYVFKGWDASTENIFCDTTLRATYDKAKRIYYTVKFVNWDGASLHTVKTKKGEDAEYTLAIPERKSDLFYNYEFVGWDKSCENIISNLTVKAVYEKTNIPADFNNVNIKNDVFTPGCISINNSDFLLSTELSEKIYSALNDSDVKKAGFYIIDCETGMTIGYNADDTFQVASTIKAAMALYACALADRGEVSLDDKYTYLESHYCCGCGIIQYEDFGKEYTLRELLHLMIYYSDNVAYYMIQDYLGYQGYNDYVTGLGVKHKHISYDSWGYITPQELGLIWQEIYRYRLENSNGEFLFEEFLDAQSGYIKTALAKYMNVAHKFGHNSDGYHDAAVVFGEHTYIMVIMTTPSTTDEEDESYFAAIARLLDEAEGEYITWLETHQY